jgi:Lar family restriction alleviation protein
MKTKLKPCPFCGGKPRIDNLGRWASVGCYSCQIWTAIIHKKAKAIKAWNRRSKEGK